MAITVKDLIELLQRFDGDRVVIMQRDLNWADYSPLSNVRGNGSWDAVEYEYGYETMPVELQHTGLSEEDLVNGIPAIVLLPNW